MRNITTVVNLILMNIYVLLIMAGGIIVLYLLLSAAKVIHWYIKKNNITWKFKP